MAYTPNRKADRLLPDLTPYPSSEYRVVMHPDVQLTAEEWLELKDYEKIESDTLVPPGTVGLQERPKNKHVAIPLHMSRSMGMGTRSENGPG